MQGKQTEGGHQSFVAEAWDDQLQPWSLATTSITYANVGSTAPNTDQVSKNKTKRKG